MSHSHRHPIDSHTGGHDPIPAATESPLGFSLLRLSAAYRLSGALCLVAMLWLAVYGAVT